MSRETQAREANVGHGRPYRFTQKYSCGHPDEYIRVDEGSDHRKRHTIYPSFQNVMTQGRGQYRLVYWLEKCRLCATNPWDLSQTNRNIVKIQAVKARQTSERRDGFEEVLHRFRYGRGSDGAISREHGPFTEEEVRTKDDIIKHPDGESCYERAERVRGEHVMSSSDISPYREPGCISIEDVSSVVDRPSGGKNSNAEAHITEGPVEEGRRFKHLEYIPIGRVAPEEGFTYPLGNLGRDDSPRMGDAGTPISRGSYDLSSERQDEHRVSTGSETVEGARSSGASGWSTLLEQEKNDKKLKGRRGTLERLRSGLKRPFSPKKGKSDSPRSPGS